MQIETPKKTTVLDILRPGMCFYLDDTKRLWLKTFLREDSMFISVIDLSTGIMEPFSVNTHVIPVNAKVVINEN